MRQQINLLNPALIKQKDLLNPINILISLSILAMLMLGYYSYIERQLLTLSKQQSQIAEELVVKQNQIKQMTLAHSAHGINKLLLENIINLEAKEEMQQQILQSINQNSTTPEKGYAAILRAFARQSMNGLWITQISIDSNTDKLSITGRAIEADLVPEYIVKLGQEPALKGKLFSALTISSQKADDLSVKSPSSQLIQPIPATLVKNNKSLTSVSVSTNESMLPSNSTKYIEFSLQSMDDATLSSNLTPVKPTSDDRKF